MSGDSIKKTTDPVTPVSDLSSKFLFTDKESSPLDKQVVYALAKAIADIPTDKTSTTPPTSATGSTTTETISPYEKAMIELGAVLVAVEAELTKMQQFTSTALTSQAQNSVSNATDSMQKLIKEINSVKSAPLWEKLVEVVVAVVSVAVGFLCGGPAGAAIALALVVAAQSGALNKLENLMEKAGFPSPGPQILVFVVITAATLGADSLSAGTSLAASTAETAAEEGTQAATEAAAEEGTQPAGSAASEEGTAASELTSTAGTESAAESQEAIQVAQGATSSAKKALTAFMKIAKVVARVSPGAQASNLYPALAQAITTNLPISKKEKEQIQQGLEFAMMAIALIGTVGMALEEAPQMVQATTKLQKFLQGGIAKAFMNESNFLKASMAAKIVNAGGTAAQAGAGINDAVIAFDNAPLFKAIGESKANIEIYETISQIANDTSQSNLKSYQTNMDELQTAVQELSETFGSGATLAKALAAFGS